MIDKDTLNSWLNLNKRWTNTRKGYCEQCRVVALNRTTNTCSVEVTSAGITKHSIKLATKNTEGGESPMVIYPRVGSFVYVSFIDDEYNGVVVNISELDRFLLKKGGNDISDAFEKIFEVLENLITEVDRLNSQVRTNRMNLTNTITLLPITSPLSVVNGAVVGQIPSRGTGTYSGTNNFVSKNESLVDEAKAIKNDIFGEGTT